jgi:hypothetical protein
MEKKFMTAREFAAAIKRPYPTVALWLRQKRIPGAFQESVGDFSIWQIPVEAVDTFEPPKPGRPPKLAAGDGGGKAAAASAQAVKLDLIEEKPKRKASKRSPAKKANVTRSAKKKGARAK